MTSDGMPPCPDAQQRASGMPTPGRDIGGSIPGMKEFPPADGFGHDCGLCRTLPIVRQLSSKCFDDAPANPPMGHHKFARRGSAARGAVDDRTRRILEPNRIVGVARLKRIAKAKGEDPSGRRRSAQGQRPSSMHCAPAQ